MHALLMRFLITTTATASLLLIGAAFVHLLPRLGEHGRQTAQALLHAPGLDWAVTYFTAAPFLLGFICAGWIGLPAAFLGQYIAVSIWSASHEAMNLRHTRGPRIVKVINHIVGRLNNHAALWITATVAPMFWVIRMIEIGLYPLLTRLVGLPAQNNAEWVNVSRQKFQGLVGCDLIWCLYCDWMTGIWSLGSEMLRNVESFWCPIRFDNAKKCENCSLDFPDVFKGWINSDGTMADVAGKLEQMYTGPDRSWFGRRVQVTINGSNQPR